MSFINKKSLRSEFDSIKTDFEHLKQNKKVSFETEMLFKSLIVLFEVMITVFLEKTTKKNSRNSSIPSSQSDKEFVCTTAKMVIISTSGPNGPLGVGPHVKLSNLRQSRAYPKRCEGGHI